MTDFPTLVIVVALSLAFGYILGDHIDEVNKDKNG